MKKRLFSLLLALCLTLSLLPLAASAEEQTGTLGVFTYKIENGEAIITKCSDAVADNVNIPDTIEGCPVVGIGSNAFSGIQTIYGVSFPKSLRFIGYGAFFGCKLLLGVTIPEGVVSVGDLAFSKCEKLMEVRLPSTLTSLGKRAFTETDFYYNQSNWDMGVLYIGNVLVDTNWYEMSKYDLAGSYSVDYGTRLIADSAFENASGITELHIPATVKYIGQYALDRAKSIWITDLAAWCAVENHPRGHWWDDYDFSYRLYVNKELVKNLVIPSGVTAIHTAAFADCGSLESVTIPGSVTEIGAYAFQMCPNLKRVTVQNGTRQIGVNSFASCDALESVSLADSVKVIGENAFHGCDALTDLKLSGNLETIENYAFAYCKGLPAVTLPGTLKSIGNSAFGTCTSLTSLTVPGSVETIGDSAFGSCTSLKTVTLRKGLKELGNNAFAGCTSLQRIAVPDGVTNVAYEAFSNCTSLTAATLPDSVTNLGARSFYNCAALKEIRIPSGCTRIQFNSFQNCTALERVDIPESISWIEEGAFSGCSKLTTVKIPSGVRQINPDIFRDCTALEKILIPESVFYVFSGAFNGCTALKDVYYPGTLENWNAITVEADNAPLTAATVHAQFVPAGIAVQPKNAVSYVGSTATFRAQATDASHTYQWQFSDDNGKTWSNSASVSSSVDCAVTAAKEGRLYRCIVKDASGSSVVSDTACLVINAAKAAKPAASANGFYYIRLTPTKENVVRMIWEFMGRPAAANSASAYYDDVSGLTAEQQTAIAWAQENIGSLATAAGKFSPGSAMTRAQLVYMLYAAYGRPAVSSGSMPYSDVSSNAFYADAVKWQYANRSKIAFGVGDGNTFCPNESVGECFAMRWKDGEPTTLQVSMAHQYDGGVVTKAATETADGQKVYTCSHCGKTKTEVIPATGTVKLPAPTLTVTLNAKGQPYLTWTAVTGAAKYEIWRAASSGGTYSKLSTTTGRSLTNSSAAAGTTYYYKVRAVASDGTAGVYSAVKSATAKLPAPTLTVKLNAKGQPYLTWTAVTGAAKYEIWRATSSGGTYTKLSTTTGRSLTNSSAAAGTTYYYKVRALDANGAAGVYSAVKSAKASLAAPTLTVKLNAKGQPYLTWTGVTGAAKYEIWRATSSGGTYTKLSTTTGKSLTNSSANAGTTYFYKVRAIASDGAAGVFSAVKSAKASTAAPTLTVKLNAKGQPYLTWTAVTGAAKYEIWRSTSESGTYTKLSTTTGKSLTNSSVTVGTTYYYKVRAMTSDGAAGPFSAVKSIRVRLAAPTLTVKLNAKGQPYLTWTAVTGAAKYEIWRSTSENGTYTKLSTTTGKSLTNSSAASGTTYYYKVRAVGSDGYVGVFSTIKSVTAK